jgi:hypothetical protein
MCAFLYLIVQKGIHFIFFISNNFMLIYLIFDFSFLTSIVKIKNIIYLLILITSKTFSATKSVNLEGFSIDFYNKLFPL